jgi:hypothetical protein
MLVETFEQKEVTTAGPECDEKQVALIRELGLVKQEALIVKSAEGKEQVCPFREITLHEKRIYEGILESKCLVEDYTAGPIPVRVLEVLKEAKQCPQFIRYQVWYETTGENKDPVLVAHTGVNDWTSNKIYLLARWGEVLRPIDEMARLAGQIKKEKVIASLRTIISKAKAYLEVAPDQPPEHFVGKSAPSAHYLEVE